MLGVSMDADCVGGRGKSRKTSRILKLWKYVIKSIQSSAFYDFGTFLQTFPIFIDFNGPKIYFSELKFSETF